VSHDNTRRVLQADGLVPHDDVSGQNERLDVDDVHVALVRAHVQPLALERQVTERQSENTQVTP